MKVNQKANKIRLQHPEKVKSYTLNMLAHKIF